MPWTRLAPSRAHRSRRWRRWLRESWLGLPRPTGRSGLDGSNGIRWSASNSRKALWHLIQMVAAGSPPPRKRPEPAPCFEATLSLRNVRPPVMMFLPLLLGAASGVGSESADRPGSESSRAARSRGSTFEPPDQPLPRAELDRLLPLQVGGLCTKPTSTRPFRRLFDTGRFSDVSIDAEPLGDGSGAAHFDATELLRGRRQLRGRGRPAQSQPAADRHQARTGEPFDESQLQAGSRKPAGTPARQWSAPRHHSL